MWKICHLQKCRILRSLMTLVEKSQFKKSLKSQFLLEFFSYFVLVFWIIIFYRFIPPQMGIQLIMSSQNLWVKMLPKVQSYLADKVYIHLQRLAHRLTLKPLHLSQINLMIKIMNILYMPTVGPCMKSLSQQMTSQNYSVS